MGCWPVCLVRRFRALKHCWKVLSSELDITIKGTVPWDFWLQVFFMNQFPPSPCVSHIRAVKNFFENSRRYSQLKVHHRWRWHQWQMEKICNQKSSNYFVWTPLGRKVNKQINLKWPWCYFQGLGRRWIILKNLKQEFLWHRPFKCRLSKSWVARQDA